jgi:hypothetical protein
MREATLPSPFRQITFTAPHPLPGVEQIEDYAVLVTATEVNVDAFKLRLLLRHFSTSADTEPKLVVADGKSTVMFHDVISVTTLLADGRRLRVEYQKVPDRRLLGYAVVELTDSLRAQWVSLYSPRDALLCRSFLIWEPGQANLEFECFTSMPTP